MFLLYLLPLIVDLFFLFGLCCMDTSTIGKWIHILIVLFMLVPGLNIVLCGIIIRQLVELDIDSNCFIRCKKFWIWLLGE